MKRGLRILIASMASIVWVILAASLLLGSAVPFGLSPNEFGDLLAGVVAPLAFFWFVIGYFQQSEELSQNTAAIQQQAEELQAQNVQLKLQYKIMKEEAEILKRGEEYAILDGFVRSFDILYYGLSVTCSNLLRAHKPETFFESWESYAKGYRDIFANSLKNCILTLGKEKFTEQHLTFFKDLSPLEEYCERFEFVLLQARRADKTQGLSKTVELSGAGAAYIAICDCLSRKPICIYRTDADEAITENMSPYGTPKGTNPDAINKNNER